jgi:hypothetical protein
MHKQQNADNNNSSKLDTWLCIFYLRFNEATKKEIIPNSCHDRILYVLSNMISIDLDETSVP